MKPKNIKHIVSVFCVTALLASVSVSAQMRQARGVEQSLNAHNNSGQAQASDENKQALKEIEMMREMIRERREQQEQQRRVLQELQQAAGIEVPMATTQLRSQDPEPSYTPTPTQGRVTSGSVLSKIDTQEREDMSVLQQKYNMEIQVAQKEIDMLKKQFSIANRQLDQCQSSSLSANNNNSYNDDLGMPALSEPKSKKAKPQKQKKVKEQASQAQPTAQPQALNENKQAMQEIEMMREMIRERREQQAQQQQMLQDLQKALN